MQLILSNELLLSSTRHIFPSCSDAKTTLRSLSPASDLCESARNRDRLHNLACLVRCRFFDTAPSFEAWEAHRYLKNRLGIVCTRDGGSLDHPYAPRPHPFVPPTEDHLVGRLTNYCPQMSSCGLYIVFLYCYIEYHMSLV